MMNNIQNGGLINKIEDQLIVTNIMEKEGLIVRGNHEERKQIYDIFPWFMNVDEYSSSLYYSDGLKKGSLCKMNLVSQQKQVIIDEPIYLLQKDKEYLYYILENDKRLYRYHLQEKKVSKILSDEINQFIIQEDVIWYTNDKGIFCLELENGRNEKISKGVAIRLVCEGDTLAYVDRERDYTISYINITSGKENKILGGMTNYINICKGMIFYSNAKDYSHLYRYSIWNDLNIKFVPEPAQNIHIFKEEVYYFNQDDKQWRGVSLQGGKSRNLIL